jgi:hypothetical protein
VNLAARLGEFGRTVRGDLARLFDHYATVDDDGPCFTDQPHQPRRVRPTCDAVEIAAMFDAHPPGRSTQGWAEFLGRCQDPATGLVGEHLAIDREFDRPPRSGSDGPDRYPTMAANYALECLGTHVPHPIHDVAAIGAEDLVARLDALSWADDPWDAGHWVDCYASCAVANARHFAIPAPALALFEWLDGHCDPGCGVWGGDGRGGRDGDGRGGWLLAVNGFYRLTRGTYAQVSRPLPYPEAAAETVWRHAQDPAVFGDGRGTACEVLDVAHPLWLCLGQMGGDGTGGAGADLAADVRAWAKDRLAMALARWVPGRGFAFDPADGTTPAGAPSLQGTEMWLSIVYMLANLAGTADPLEYVPRGVHRLEGGHTLTP